MSAGYAGETGVPISSTGIISHIFGGPYRKKSEKYGLVVLLCHERCHIYGENAVHRNADVATFLKRWGQNKAMREQGWSTKEFVKQFGKNYLEV